MNEILHDLWNDKPLLIAGVVGIGTVIYILVKNNNGGAVATPTSQPASTQTYPVAPAATYVEDTHYNYQNNSNNVSTSTSTSTQSVTPVPPTTKMQVLPAGTGTLNGTTKSAGKGDTNFWVYAVASGQTIASITSKVAHWGGKWQDLVNYRNNAAILQSVGVDITNPNATVPAGTLISV